MKMVWLVKKDNEVVAIAHKRNDAFKYASLFGFVGEDVFIEYEWYKA